MELLEDIQPEVSPAASKTRRVAAALIDMFVLFLFALLLSALIRTNSFEPGVISINLEGWSAGLWYLGSYLILVIPEGMTSKTLGKWFLNLKVVKRDTSQNTFASSATRHLLDIVDCFLLIGLLVASKDANNQRIGDRAADTVVVDG